MSAISPSLPRIAIVLATYNGSEYIAAQLDSLFAQDYEDFIIVARDDASQDGTLAILQHYANSYPNKLHLLENEGKNLGASANFAMLIEYVLAHKATLGIEYAYIMCCDQDDVWHQGKIGKSVQAMLQLETEHPFRACLVHSDLRVIDANGQELAASFFAYQGIRAEKNSFARMLVSNSVTGCTMLINEKLAQLASPIPAQAVMHDWWLALVASSVGHVRPINEALLDYRQHSSNTLGAKRFTSSAFSIQKLRKLSDPQYDALTAQLATQAAHFAGRHYANLKNRDTFVLSIALGMASKRRWVRNAVLFSFILLAT